MRSVALQCLLIALLCATAVTADPVASHQRQVDQLIESAGSAARKIVLYRDIALRAVENAFAIQDQAELKLLEALRGGDRERIAAARRDVRNAVQDSEAAVGMTERILEFARRAARSAVLADECAAEIPATTSARRTRRARRKVESHRDDAMEEMEDAGQVLDELKEKWLIPISRGKNNAHGGRAVGLRR